MKKFILSLIMALVTVPAFAGSTVVLSNNTDTEGGYYDAVLTTETNEVMEFKTFCLEYSEHFTPDTPYNVTIDSTIQNSGATPADLDDVTKKLYASYLNSIEGDAMNLYGAGSGSTYSQLQEAFWAIESGTPKVKFVGGVFSNNLVTVVRDSATNVQSVTLNSSLILNTTGYENVMVLNLWAGEVYTSTALQSQLIRVSTTGGGDDNPVVPAPAAVLLSGFGTCLVGLVRRRSL